MNKDIINELVEETIRDSNKVLKIRYKGAEELSKLYIRYVGHDKGELVNYTEDYHTGEKTKIHLINRIMTEEYIRADYIKECRERCMDDYYEESRYSIIVPYKNISSIEIQEIL